MNKKYAVILFVCCMCVFLGRESILSNDHLSAAMEEPFADPFNYICLVKTKSGNEKLFLEFLKKEWIPKLAGYKSVKHFKLYVSNQNKAVNLITGHRGQNPFQLVHAIESIITVDLSIIIVKVPRNADQSNFFHFRIDIGKNHSIHQTTILSGNQPICLSCQNLGLIAIIGNFIRQY